MFLEMESSMEGSTYVPVTDVDGVLLLSKLSGTCLKIEHWF